MSKQIPILNRRTVFAGAGAAGAMAAAAALLPRAQPSTVVAAAPAAKPDAEAGYRVTAHVQRYYDTTRV